MLGLVAPSALPAVELLPGVEREVVLEPQTEPFLYDQLTFDVPAGATWAIVEVTVGSPDQDVDLYLRFGQPPARTPAGTIAADFSSTSVAGAAEGIFLSPTGAPPLQTGRYYAALEVRSLNTPIRAKIRYSVQLAGVQQSFITSTFDLNDEGWTRNFPPSSIPGASLGDSDAALARDPAGFLRIQDGNGPLREFAVAPAKFLGDLSRFSNAQLVYDFRHFDGGIPVFRKEVRILGAGAVWSWFGDPPPAEDWTKVVVPLEPGQWTRTSGTATFEQTLSNVARIEISMDHAAGPELADLDNIVFTGGPPETPSGPGGPASSDFESGNDGWTRNFPASPVPGAITGTQNAAVVTGLGGKDSERYLLMIDGGLRDVDWVVAPPKFITGLSALNRPWYEFWYRRIDGAFPFHAVRLRLYGNGSVFEWSGARARDEWVRFRVPIDAENWLHLDGPEDFDAMLRNVQRLEVSMDMANGREANGLDEFHLRLDYTPPSGRALVLGPEQVEVQVARGEGPVTRPLEITATGAELDWSAEIKPADTSWLSLSQTNGATPDAINLIFDTAGLGPAIYRADVIVTPANFLAPAKTLPVTLIVGADPRIPVLNAGGVVHAAHPLVPLSPGALGSLYGEFLFEGQAAPGFVAGTDRLPVNVEGVSVRFETADGSLLAQAPLLFLSPGQINFQTPFETAGQMTSYVTVVRDGATSNRVPVAIAAAGPGVFDVGGGLFSVVNQDGSLNSGASGAAPGEIVTVYFSGAGLVNPALETGRATPDTQLYTPQGGLTTTVGGQDARVLGAALSPGFVGLAQLSFEVPQGLPAGQHVLTLTIAGRNSNGVSFFVRTP
ncbi:MAG: laminin B domain-containing protein [Bryobacterales bacterium]